jgi:sugar lactone lactonase YvrE
VLISRFIHQPGRTLACLLFWVVLCVTSTVQAQEYQWTNFVGKPGIAGHVDGPALDALFNDPWGLARAADGTLYVADTRNKVIRKITPNGVVSTIAGKVGVGGFADGPGLQAEFVSPKGIALDRNGNLYVTDHDSHTVRKISAVGVVSTLAGKGGFEGSANGTRSAARFRYPMGIAVDRNGYVYVADSGNHAIRKISPSGVVSILAGSGSLMKYGHLNGKGTAARFHNPQGVAVNASGIVFVTDNATVRKITAAGVVSTLAGTPGIDSHTDGTGAGAQFSNPSGICADAAGYLYVADAAAVRVVSPAFVVTTLAGPGAGNNEGSGPAARFSGLSGCVVDATGLVYVVDSGNHRIREITPAGVVSAYAGEASASNEDGVGRAANFNRPQRCALDSSGNLYVADTNNHTLRKVTPAGVVTTLAGLAGMSGSADGTGSNARFSSPLGVAVDSSGYVYVADNGNHTVRKVSPAGEVSTLAGLAGVSGHTNATGSSARFTNPNDVAVDASDYVYVTSGNAIRKITPAGEVTTFAGNPTQLGATNGTGTAALFRSPAGLAVDTAGTLFVADVGNDMIRKITAAGVVSTHAGGANLDYSLDGFATLASFDSPSDVAVDAAGNLYVADRNASLIRKITPSRDVTTIGGSLEVDGFQDGRAKNARFWEPTGIAASADGQTLYVADNYNNRISRGTAMYPPELVLNAVSNLTASTVRFNATVDANGRATTALFEYGTTTAYGSSVPVTLSPDNSLTPQIVSATATGLTMGLTYYVRLKASNGHGESTTQYRTFIPAGPLSITFADPNTPPLVYGPDTTNLTLTGSSLASVTFAFSPPLGATYTLLNLDHSATIASGTFTGLADGATLTVPHQGDTLYFRIQYSGRHLDSHRPNDITLTRIAGPGQVMRYEWHTLAGQSGQAGSTNATGSAARFNTPFDVAVSHAGDLFIADRNNCTIRKCTPTGVVTALAGSPLRSGSTNGKGAAARFMSPGDIVVQGFTPTFIPTNLDTIYVSDWGNHTIRSIRPDGTVTTHAGKAGAPGYVTSVPLASARYYWPSGLAIDSMAKLFVVDKFNGVLRQLSGQGLDVAKAGQPSVLGAVNGYASYATFRYPCGLAYDEDSNSFYIADHGNHLIRKYNLSNSQVTTLAGVAVSPGSTDGPAGSAQFSYPRDVVCSEGAVLVADYANHTIRHISASGVVSTVGGTPGVPGSTEGQQEHARFRYPAGLCVSADGVVYLADSGNHRICAGLPGLTPIISLGPVQALPGSVTLSGSINPNGLMTSAAFEYGSTTSYGSTEPVVLSPSNGTASQNASATISGLTTGQLYHYRLTATNLDGTTSTMDGTFTP